MIELRIAVAVPDGDRVELRRQVRQRQIARHPDWNQRANRKQRERGREQRLALDQQAPALEEQPPALHPARLRRCLGSARSDRHLTAVRITEKTMSGTLTKTST